MVLVRPLRDCGCHLQHSPSRGRRCPETGKWHMIAISPPSPKNMGEWQRAGTMGRCSTMISCLADNQGSTYRFALLGPSLSYAAIGTLVPSRWVFIARLARVAAPLCLHPARWLWRVPSRRDRFCFHPCGMRVLRLMHGKALLRRAPRNWGMLGHAGAIAMIAAYLAGTSGKAGSIDAVREAMNASLRVSTSSGSTASSWPLPGAGEARRIRFERNSKECDQRQHTQLVSIEQVQPVSTGPNERNGKDADREALRHQPPKLEDPSARPRAVMCHAHEGHSEEGEQQLRGAGPGGMRQHFRIALCQEQGEQ